LVRSSRTVRAGMARLPSPAGRIPAALVVLLVGLVGVAGAAQRSAFVGRKQAVLPKTAFRIGGASLADPLRPGTSQALDLRLTNPHRHSLAITKVTVAIAIDRAHARAGCDARRDFRTIAMPAGTYPIRLRPQRTVSLRALGVRALPRVAMAALPRNQDPCKGARLTLKLGGSARRWSTGR
jgi:hypothetical protein